jgi:biofilm PGA synthesis lipoprotein PgaB
MRIVIILSMLVLTGSACAAEVELMALAYHDVRTTLVRDYDPRQYAVTSANLAGHFRWLQSQGYHVVDVDQLSAALDGQTPLPEKAVLLTFDDGFRSVYTHVFPLLKTFGYPAVVSLVTRWIESDRTVGYDGVELGRDDFLTWEQIREMQDSGLIEFASHSNDLHHGIPGNPQDNLQPAAVTLRYDDGVYETEEQYLTRIEDDLATSSRMIESATGRRPRIITWPYGAWNQSVRSIAARYGMQLSLTLQSADFTSGDGVIVREMLVSNPGIPLFAALFEQKQAPPLRAAQVDLDYVYDPEPERQETNLGLLLDRIKKLQISHVFLQAFADPDGDGAADALYFPNRRLPMRADLFNRAAWQLTTRANVRVYAWLPLLAYTGPTVDDSWRVVQNVDGQIGPDPNGEPRLSPFHPDARQFIVDIYRDLAIHAQFEGIHFHDDGRLNESEDASEAALAVYADSLGEPFSFEAAAGDAKLIRRWTAVKTAALTELSNELADVVRIWHPEMKTSRNLFAPAVLDPETEIHLAQNYVDYLANYDYVTLMAMPRFENVRNARKFYLRLIRAADAQPRGMEQTVFQLQAFDWRRAEPISSETLRDTMRFLQSKGVRNLAYYPEDFIAGHPQLELLKQGISLAETPWGPER